jgi:hypothetical protein
MSGNGGFGALLAVIAVLVVVTLVVSAVGLTLEYTQLDAARSEITTMQGELSSLSLQMSVLQSQLSQSQTQSSTALAQLQAQLAQLQAQFAQLQAQVALLNSTQQPTGVPPNAQYLIQSTFQEGTLGGWAMYCKVDDNTTSSCGGYHESVANSGGSACLLVSGDDLGRTDNGVSRTVNLVGPESHLVLSFDWRGAADTAYTNDVAMEVVDSTNGTLYFNTLAGQVRGVIGINSFPDTGWRHFSADIASAYEIASLAASHGPITIRLFIEDSWNANYHETASFDNITLYFTPENENGIGDEC